MLKLVLGRSGGGKTTHLLQGLQEQGIHRPQIFLVPDQQSHQVERALCEMGGAQVSQYAEVLSFSRLCNRIFQHGGGMGIEELDGGGRILLMHRAVQSVSSQLTALRRASHRPAFLTGLLTAVDELKSCCVTPQVLLMAGEEMEGQEGEKLRDLALIAGSYDALTAESVLDPRDRLTRATLTLKRCEWGRGRDIWLDGFTDFTPQQRQLLAVLLGQCHSMTVALTCGALEGEEDIFIPARRTAQQLLQLARDSHVSSDILYVTQKPPFRSGALHHLEGAVFGDVPHDPPSPEGEIALFSALTPRSEVEWTASEILRLVREEGYRYRDIGVVARDFEGYRPLISTILPRYGIPVFTSAMTSILEKPVLLLVTAALDVVAGGYRYEDIFRYLKTGLTDLSADDVDLLENYVIRWNPRGSQWTSSRGFTLHPRGYGLPFQEEDTAQLARLNVARLAVVEPLETLRKNRTKTGAGQAMALYAFLEKIGLPQRFQQRVAGLRQSGKPQLADEYRQLWSILTGGLEQCAALLGDVDMELEEFSSLFRLVLSQYQVGSIPVSLDRVSAGETTRQTGHRVKVLFFLGVEDGSVPMVTPDSGLISHEERSLLRSYGVELNQDSQEELVREMTTVYQMCALPSRYLAITYPRQGTGGEERRPAFLVERLTTIFPTLTPIREESLGGRFRLAAPLPALERAGDYSQVEDALGEIPQYEDQIARLRGVRQRSRGRLSPEMVERLYGKKVPMSASRMDKYKSCHFSYFMQYGLRAQPRKSGGFAAPEYGTFVHYVLEQVLGSEDWKGRVRGGSGVSQEESRLLRTLVDGAIAQYVEEELGGLEGQTDRFRYLFRRLRSAVRSVVENAAQELAVSQFQPISFELGFARDGDLPPVEMTVGDMTVSISGFVDRVDGWEKDGRLYLRVVDYKTGRKSFDLTEIWNGLGLQMLLYLFTLEERGEALYQKPIDGAGVLYFPAREVVVKGSRTMGEEAQRRAADKELVRSGLILDDPSVLEAMEHPGDGGYRFLPLKVSKVGAVTGDALVSAERFGKLQQHIQQILTDICDELTAGTIAADPYWRGAEKNACHYCDFADACQFEEGQGGDCRRYLPTIKNAIFWNNLEQSEEETNDE